MRVVLIAAMLSLTTACQQKATQSPQPAKETVAIKGCSKDLKVCEDGQAVGRDTNNQCEFFACPAPREVTACPEDMKQCPDGSFVYRDQTQHCEFATCPAESNSTLTKPEKIKDDSMMCTQEVKQCADGSYVGRDSSKKCAFKPCPEETDSK